MRQGYTRYSYCLSIFAFQAPITQEEGQKLGKKINALAYMECSALTREGVRELFESATRAALNPKKRKARMKDRKGAI